jgi:hypothetical protein
MLLSVKDAKENIIRNNEILLSPDDRRNDAETGKSGKQRRVRSSTRVVSCLYTTPLLNPADQSRWRFTRTSKVWSVYIGRRGT